MRRITLLCTLVIILSIFGITLAFGASAAFKNNIYNPGQLKPIDSKLNVKIGEPAPDFTLPSVSGEKISLSQFRGKKNVVISFVPAAWTPVCSD
ncbi:MAG: redoxin domain-containing protein, partial [Desulfobacterales bacterium]